MFKIGIMQGRLLPWYKNNYQSHPVNFWQSEFYIAKELGFYCIEFILDYNEADKNPLLNKSGLKEIDYLSKTTQVKVNSICADYFMKAPFHSKHQLNSEKMLIDLIKHASVINIKDIVIPCVDESSLKTNEDFDLLYKSLVKILPFAEDENININIEADLNPKTFKDFINRFESKNIKVNYDSGNSSSQGYDIYEEFKEYGTYISDVHIKDRKLNGESVSLGEGDANIRELIKLLNEYNLTNCLIMQASRSRDYIADLQGLFKQKKYLDDIILRINDDQ